ncbi:hypothetical protein [Oleiagrimonas sp.]|uniref:hypothetical protein n=1 Tax=Oleiagrimonas sp. TaxID=2010330 RepID=UPI0026130197|nr:hypothetical protein [Oleiagrimonas sp.]MDA3913366.1 hypothetical protein [Oleiagrimonas sp.]
MDSGARCRRRAKFRNFRLDRISVIDAAGDGFEDVPEQGLDAWLKAMLALSARLR